MGIAGVRPSLGFLGFSARGPEGFFAPHRGALNEPPSAAGIAGSRPGGGPGFAALRPAGFFPHPFGALQMCRLRRRGLPGPAPAGGFGFAALRPTGLFPHPFGAFQMCRLRRHRLPGPAPAGGPTSCTPKKSAEERRSRGLPPVPLRIPREYLAMTRELPPLPTGTQAEGSIQVAGAPNDRGRMARRKHTAENNARSGRSRALRACAA